MWFVRRRIRDKSNPLLLWQINIEHLWLWWGGVTMIYFLKSLKCNRFFPFSEWLCEWYAFSITSHLRSDSHTHSDTRSHVKPNRNTRSSLAKISSLRFLLCMLNISAWLVMGLFSYVNKIYCCNLALAAWFGLCLVGMEKSLFMLTPLVCSLTCKRLYFFALSCSRSGIDSRSRFSS